MTIMFLVQKVGFKKKSGLSLRIFLNSKRDINKLPHCSNGRKLQVLLRTTQKD